MAALVQHGLCKMCGARPSSAKSHIYPRALYADLPADPQDQVLLIPADPNQRAQRRPSGVWDNSILCHDCERRFQRYDHHLVEALRRDVVPSGRWDSPDVKELPEASARELKLAVMHICWRAHHSVQDGFASFSIGPRVDALRSLLLADDDGGRDVFPVLLCRQNPDPDDLHGWHASPVTLRWRAPERPRAAWFQIMNWRLMITPSKAPVRKGWERVMLAPGQPVPVVTTGQPFLESHEAREAAKLFGRRAAAGVDAKLMQ